MLGSHARACGRCMLGLYRGQAQPVPLRLLSERRAVAGQLVIRVASSGAGFGEDPVPPPAGKSSCFISYGADLSAFDDVAAAFVGGVWVQTNHQNSDI